MSLRDVFKKMKPMLATSSEPFDAKDYIFEVKWDGFRCLSYLDGTTTLHSRNQLDFTHKFPELADIHKLARQGPLILDGEIIIMDGGVPSFYELQKRGWTQGAKAAGQAARVKPATYVVFDVLYVGDRKLINLPLAERKEILREAVEQNDRLFLSEGIPERGMAFYQACIAKDLEGVVAKKLDSLYLPAKRSAYWKKFKKAFEGDFVICGFKQTHQASERVDVLLLGCLSEDQYIFQGTVGVGLAGLPGQHLFKLLSSHRNEHALFRVPKEVSRGLTWVAPRFCCSVQFLEPAKDGGLRHPVFRGLREDMNPEDCTGIAGAIAGRTGRRRTLF